MPNYQNGKLYTIRSHQTDKVYVGSTTQVLSVRMGGHRANFKLYNNGGGTNYVSSFELLTYDDAYIELIELYPCNSKTELDRGEGVYIRQMDCVNKNIAGRTMAEYYQDNKEQLTERQKQYYQDNKEQIKQYYQDNKEKLAERHKQYYQDNREEIKQYYQDNREQIVERKKQYYQDNREQIAERNKKKFSCECGGKYTYINKATHLRSKKHQKYFNK